LACFYSQLITSSKSWKRFNRITTISWNRILLLWLLGCCMRS
jgi:hypothetical protein